MRPYRRDNPRMGPDAYCPHPGTVEPLRCEPTFHVCFDAYRCNCSGRELVDRREALQNDDYFCPICLTSASCIDLKINDDDDLDFTHGIESHALVSLAVRGRQEEVPDDSGEPLCPDLDRWSFGNYGGWWWDSFKDTPIGSRLWTLEGEPSNNETRLRAEEMIREALDVDGMIERGEVSRVEIDSEIDECGTLCVRHIVFHGPSGAVTKADVRCLWQRSA